MCWGWLKLRECKPALVLALLCAGRAMGGKSRGVGWPGCTGAAGLEGQMLWLFGGRNTVICLGVIPTCLCGCNTVQGPGGWSHRTGQGMKRLCCPKWCWVEVRCCPARRIPEQNLMDRAAEEDIHAASSGPWGSRCSQGGQIEGKSLEKETSFHRIVLEPFRQFSVPSFC